MVVLVRRGGAIPNAVECFEKAVALDTEYALACAGLAHSYTVLGYYGLSRPETCMPKGIEAARRALALDPSLAEAHAALAMASLMGAWDKAGAEPEFLRALELNPRYLQARDWYALLSPVRGWALGGGRGRGEKGPGRRSAFQLCQYSLRLHVLSCRKTCGSHPGM